MLAEFDIIRTYFEQPGLAAKTGEIIRVGIGDDCALLAVPQGKELAVSMDTLVAGVHFPQQADPALVAYHALAVNLSDLAAMGAAPVGFTLGLSLPQADADWLQAFSQGLKDCAIEYRCPLIGGDTTRGPLVITIQVHGLVGAGSAIRRSGAAPGDRIYVTGSLGGAALAIRKLLAEAATSGADLTQWEQAFYRPQPRIDIGMQAAGIVSAGIDISDGLLADLGHICERSFCGASIRLQDIPQSGLLAKAMPANEALALALTGGDDYELVLTAHPGREKALMAVAQKHGVPLHCIGDIVEGEGVICLDGDGMEVIFPNTGYLHFRHDV